MHAASPSIPVFSSERANAGCDLHAAVHGVLQRQWFVLGQEVAAFETEFARYCGVEHAVGVANGTDALVLALRALGVSRGDRVILAANAGFYGSTALHLIGAIAHYVDVADDTLTLDPAALRSALTEQWPNPAKAVIVTHLYGQLADMPALLALCQQHGVPLLEDCAQAHGAQHQGQRAGSFGDIAAFSFYPTKNLGAVGDGGAVLTRRGDLAAQVRTLRQYGWSAKYTVGTPLGCNSRLDEIQAAVLRAKLPMLDRQNAERRAIATRYVAALRTLPVQLPASTGEDHAAHLFVLRTPQRDALRLWLLARGIGCDVHYPIPDHQQPAYAETSAAVHLPVTERACATVLTLPCFPGLRPDETERVISAVQAFFAQGPG